MILLAEIITWHHFLSERCE